jgi:hypothetical protein
MGSNRFISWTAFTLFVLAVVVAVLVVIAPTLAPIGLPISEAVAIWVIGVLALLSAILGFLAFKTPQGKIAAIGGVLLLLAVLYVTPIVPTISR